MQVVRIRAEELQAVIRENRSKHIKEADEAQVDYRIALVSKLEELLASAKAGDIVAHVISLPVPQDHRREYDRVLRMLELSADEVVELQQQEFVQYVLDEWSWKQAFAITNSTYKSASFASGSAGSLRQ